METNTQAWDDLLGEALLSRYKLHTLTFKGRDQAEFLAEPLDNPNGAPVTITLIASEGTAAEDLLADIERASRLEHPNILKILNTGLTSIRGSEYVYLAAETPEHSLAKRLNEGRLSSPEARILVRDLVAALEFLHARGLACCAVEPETVVWVSGAWKLADLSRVQPLEIVTPKQDIAALGALIRDVFGGKRPPAPFDEMVAGCLGVDGAPRLSLGQVRALTASPLAPPSGRKPRVMPLWAAGFVGVAAVALGLWAWGHSSSRASEPAPVPPPVVKPAPVPAPQAPPVNKPSPYQRFTPGSAERAKTPPPSSKSNGAETGRADFFNVSADGHLTASGVRVNSRDLVAAHARYPFGTRLKVTNLRNGKSVVVRVVNRRSAAGGRILSVSEEAARELGFLGAGWANVKVERAP